MRKLTNLGLFTLALVSLAVAVAAQKTETVPANGILYKISGNGLQQPSYVFGTVHLACPDRMFPAEKLKPFVERSGRVVLEVDMDDPLEVASMAAAVRLPAGKTFKSALTPEQFAKVSEYLESTIGLKADQVQMINPTLLGVLILSQPSILGCEKASSYEERLVSLAAAAKLPVLGLEKAAYQVEVLGKIPLEAQAKQLYEMAVDPKMAIRQFNELKDAYYAQDSELLFRVSREQSKGYEAMSEVLLDARNKAWLPKVESLMKERGTFFGVGGAHLGGPTGIITRLRESGYTVEAIKL